MARLRAAGVTFGRVGDVIPNTCVPVLRLACEDVGKVDGLTIAKKPGRVAKAAARGLEEALDGWFGRWLMNNPNPSACERLFGPGAP